MGKKKTHTHTVMDWETMQPPPLRPKKHGYEWGFPLALQRWLITEEVRGSLGTERWTKLRKNGNAETDGGG